MLNINTLWPLDETTPRCKKAKHNPIIIRINYSLIIHYFRAILFFTQINLEMY